MAQPKTIGADDLHVAIDRLASALAAQHAKTPKLVLLGIANGGIELARRLGAKLKLPVGTLDISFHRDDFGSKPIPKEFSPTLIPLDVTGATVVLVDDVLFSGRTVKAALDELFDHGRPAKVELAILVERGGRKVPVASNYQGMILDVKESEKVKVILDPADPAKDAVHILTPAPLKT